jgi:Fe2+ transport system protein FeoA
MESLFEGIGAMRNSATQPPNPINLTQLRAGDYGRLHAAELTEEDASLLMALGLARRARFRVSKAGDPWILEVRSTRIGMSDAVARGLQVIPEAQR